MFYPKSVVFTKHGGTNVSGVAKVAIAKYVDTTPPIKPTVTICTLNIFSCNDAVLQQIMDEGQ